jgi:integrase
MKGRHDRALPALAYDTLCRRSELVALRVTDIETDAEGDATVLIARSKTDQEGVGMVRYIAPDTRRHLEAWISAAGIADGALFRSVGRGGRVGGALDTGDVARIFKRMAAAAGISPDAVASISGHSSRVGAAQDMVRHSVELPAVMQAGGWRTAEMVGRYTRRLDARRSGAAKLAILQNRT